MALREWERTRDGRQGDGAASCRRRRCYSGWTLRSTGPRPPPPPPLPADGVASQAGLVPQRLPARAWDKRTGSHSHTQLNNCSDAGCRQELRLTESLLAAAPFAGAADMPNTIPKQFASCLG